MPNGPTIDYGLWPSQQLRLLPPFIADRNTQYGAQIPLFGRGSQEQGGSACQPHAFALNACPIFHLNLALTLPMPNQRIEFQEGYSVGKTYTPAKAINSNGR